MPMRVGLIISCCWTIQRHEPPNLERSWYLYMRKDPPPRDVLSQQISGTFVCRPILDVHFADKGNPHEVVGDPAGKFGYTKRHNTWTGGNAPIRSRERRRGEDRLVKFASFIRHVSTSPETVFCRTRQVTGGARCFAISHAGWTWQKVPKGMVKAISAGDASLYFYRLTTLLFSVAC